MVENNNIVKVLIIAFPQAAITTVWYSYHVMPLFFTDEHATAAAGGGELLQHAELRQRQHQSPRRAAGLLAGVSAMRLWGDCWDTCPMQQEPAEGPEPSHRAQTYHYEKFQHPKCDTYHLNMFILFISIFLTWQMCNMDSEYCMF